jgi:hypothetical protein
MGPTGWSPSPDWDIFFSGGYKFVFSKTLSGLAWQLQRDPLIADRLLRVPPGVLLIILATCCWMRGGATHRASYAKKTFFSLAFDIEFLMADSIFATRF